MNNNCDENVFKYGEIVGVAGEWSKEEAEKWCVDKTRETGDWYDWHYVAGRAVIKMLPKDWKKPQSNEELLERIASLEELVKFNNEIIEEQRRRIELLCEGTDGSTSALVRIARLETQIDELVGKSND